MTNSDSDGLLKRGSDEWDQLVKEGWVISDDELAKLLQAGGRGDGEVAEVNRHRRELGLPPDIALKRPRGASILRTTTVKVSDESLRELRRIAASFGWLHGGDGNLTALMEAIGQGTLKVVEMSDSDVKDPFTEE